jgi:bilirubin oxidase
MVLDGRLTRREVLTYGAGAGVGLFFVSKVGVIKVLAGVAPAEAAPAGGGLLDPGELPKYVTPLVIPPAMPRTTRITRPGMKPIDVYEIAVRQFSQQILPPGRPPTTVWSYGSVNHPGTFNYPAFTIEAKWETPVRVTWINGLVDASGHFQPHLLPVDQTLHWANPPGGTMHRDHRGTDPTPYAGPVPIVTHVHGAHTSDESDGYASAWYVPAANNIPSGYASTGTWYAAFKQEALAEHGVTWAPGTATFQYPNDQAAATLWYHDHSLGMTRLNVYAGPAGFYLLRGGPSDGVAGTLPGPAPALGDPAGVAYHEIPLAIQDRAFNANGSLFYPDTRAYFEGLRPDQLQIPFIPDSACDGPSDVSPIWNPEFFGNTMVVNGRTWPTLDVEQRRYRFRFLNGCNSRFVILKLVTGDPTHRPAVAALPLWQIGAEGGFLPAPVRLDHVLMSPAERADVIVDFTDVPLGTEVFLVNEGPDEPFGGGIPGEDFLPANPGTTGQVMRFVVRRRRGRDASTPPANLVLPPRAPLPPSTTTRRVSLNEQGSSTVRVVTDDAGNVVLDCTNPEAETFGPTAAALGTVEGTGGVPLMWSDPISENPALGATETWEIYNFTEDAHPIHIHEVQFEVVNRQPFDPEEGRLGPTRPPEPSETGTKDTVIAYPEEVTRVKSTFDLGGLFVWHCHIVEHEDNEMMRPYVVGKPAFFDPETGVITPPPS